MKRYRDKINAIFEHNMYNKSNGVWSNTVRVYGEH